MCVRCPCRTCGSRRVWRSRAQRTRRRRAVGSVHINARLLHCRVLRWGCCRVPHCHAISLTGDRQRARAKQNPRARAEAPPSWAVWQRTVLPNGVATGLDIAFSNTSFEFITLSFYTMCKSSAPLFLLLFAFLWGIEKPTWPLAATVCVISAGLLLLVAGEVEFDALGFVLVMSAACMSGLRWTITQVLLQARPTLRSTLLTCTERPPQMPGSCAAACRALSNQLFTCAIARRGARRARACLSAEQAARRRPPCVQGGGEGGAGGHSVARGTALEVLEAVTPVMSATSFVAALFFEPLVATIRSSIYFSSAAHLGVTLALVAASAVLAFAMVWVEFALIATTSALTFMVAGVFKEIVTVLVAHAVFGDEFTRLNGFGLAVLISGVCLFNWQKWRKLREARRNAGRERGARAAGSRSGREAAREGRGGLPNGVNEKDGASDEPGDL
jgi:drug/metabolite transporter (DMT)-like permease